MQINYDGVFLSQHIYEWLQYRVSSSIIKFENCLDLKHIMYNQMQLLEDEVLVVYYPGKNKNNQLQEEASRNIFEQVAMLVQELDNRLYFGELEELNSFCESQISADFHIHHSNNSYYDLSNPAIFIFKPIVPTVFINQNFEEKYLADWILVTSMHQTLTMFDPEYQHQLFGIITPTVLLMGNIGEIKKNADLFQVYQDLAFEYYGYLKFLVMDSKQIDDKIKSQLSFTDQDVKYIDGKPNIMIIQPDNRIIKRYTYKGEGFLKNELIKFLEEFENSHLEPEFRNQEIAESLDQQTHYVKVINGTKFRNVILNDQVDKDYLLVVNRDNCQPCVQFDSLLDILAQRMSHLQSVIFAKISVTHNELGVDLPISSYPTIYFKSGVNLIKFKEPRTIENLENFITQNSQVYLKSKLDKEEDEDDRLLNQQVIPVEPNYEDDVCGVDTQNDDQGMCSTGSTSNIKNDKDEVQKETLKEQRIDDKQELNQDQAKDQHQHDNHKDLKEDL